MNSFWKSSARTFLGIGDFMGSKVARLIVEGWFRLLGWAAFTGATLVLGIKTDGVNLGFFTSIGVLSLVFLALYSFHFWFRDVEKAFAVSIDEVNERNKRIFGDDTHFQYKKFPNLPAAWAIILIALILNLMAYGLIFEVLLYFTNSGI